MSRIPSVRSHRKGYLFIRIEGKDHYLGYDKTKAHVKADSLLADYLKRRNLPAPAPAPTEELSIEELGIRYLLWAQDYYQFDGRDTGVYPRHRWSIQLLIDHYGQSAPSSFGPLALKRLREIMVESGLAMSTINARINIIRQCFRWGAENELCDSAVFHSLQVVRGLQKGRTKAKAPKKVKPVPNNAIEAIQPYLPPTVGDMVLLQMHSGMRSGELINLKFEDIDRSKSIWRYEPKSHKSERHDKERIVRFGPECQKILQKYFDEIGDDPTAYVFSPRRTVELSLQRRRKSPKVDQAPKQRKRMPGVKYRRDSYRTAIQRACDKAGIEKWFPHQLRHLAGTLARDVAGLDGAQHFLGHSNADVTQVYAEVNDAKADAVAEQIG